MFTIITIVAAVVGISISAALSVIGWLSAGWGVEFAIIAVLLATVPNYFMWKASHATTRSVTPATNAPEKPIEPDDLREPAPDEDVPDKAFVRFVFSLDRDERLDVYERLALDVLVDTSGEVILVHQDEEFTPLSLCDTVKEVPLCFVIQAKAMAAPH